MAYIGYDTRVHATRSRPLHIDLSHFLPSLAWGRLTVLGLNVVVWAGIVAAVRACFF